MAGLSCSTRIRATQQQVFDAISDLEHAADRITGIERVEVLTDGPMGVGTRWRETRVMFKKEHTEEMWVTEFDAPNGYRVNAESCGCLYDTAMTVTPDGEEIILEMSFTAKPRTFAAKLMMPLTKVMAGSMRKMTQQDLEDIKNFVESGGAVGVRAF